MDSCRNCGERHGYAVVAHGDVEQCFDYATPWRGLRLLCPGCGSLIKTSFAPLTLTNTPDPRLPSDLRVHAVVGAGPEVYPLTPAG